MLRPKVIRKLGELTQLEKQHLELLTNTRTLMEALKPVRSMFRNLRVDMREGNPTDPEWLDKFDKATEAAWVACKGVYELLPEANPEPISDTLVDVVRAAKEVVQADNACIFGRTGCEQRWDKAMDELKHALSFVRDQ